MSENQNTCEVNDTSCVKCEKLPYVIIIVLLVIISVLAFFVGKNYDTIVKNQPAVTTTTPNNTPSTTTSGALVDASNVTVKVIWDKRCPECPTAAILWQLKQLPFLNGAKFEELDFSDEWVNDILKANDIKTLPAFLLNTKDIADQQFAQYLMPTKSGLFSLNVGAEFDPYAEVCDNGKDDNGDAAIDCADTTCSKALACAPKVDRPVADLYIMSYCPYGLQAQKGYLEVMSKLWKVADINVKFVQYVMHEQKEADENVVQHCIQKEQKETYTKYLNCFLKEEWKGAECRKEAGINEQKLTSCIDATKKEFKVDENMKDTSKQFPDFNINKEEALAAGVQGSPTFVLNGIKIDKIGRNAQAYAKAICGTFKTEPKECEEGFQDINFDPMFGFTSNGSNADSGCAQ